MITRVFILTLFILLGIVAMPTQSMACGSKSAKTEKSCCNKKNFNSSKEESCCNDEDSCSDKSKKGCGGKCGKKSCPCPNSVSNSFPILNKSENLLLNFNVDIMSTEIINIAYEKSFYSTDFSFIWAPPKISM